MKTATPMRCGKKWARRKILLRSKLLELEKAGQLTLLSSPAYVKTKDGALKMEIEFAAAGGFAVEI